NRQRRSTPGRPEEAVSRAYSDSETASGCRPLPESSMRPPTRLISRKSRRRKGLLRTEKRNKAGTRGRTESPGVFNVCPSLAALLSFTIAPIQQFLLFEQIDLRDHPGTHLVPTVTQACVGRTVDVQLFGPGEAVIKGHIDRDNSFEP